LPFQLPNIDTGQTRKRKKIKIRETFQKPNGKNTSIELIFHLREYPMLGPVLYVKKFILVSPTLEVTHGCVPS
jgi:hypothetical protein